MSDDERDEELRNLEMELMVLSVNLRSLSDRVMILRGKQ